jgi:hypothetical protein
MTVFPYGQANLLSWPRTHRYWSERRKRGPMLWMPILYTKAARKTLDGRHTTHTHTHTHTTALVGTHAENETIGARSRLGQRERKIFWQLVDLSVECDVENSRRTNGKTPHRQLISRKKYDFTLKVSKQCRMGGDIRRPFSFVCSHAI